MRFVELYTRADEFGVVSTLQRNVQTKSIEVLAEQIWSSKMFSNILNRKLNFRSGVTTNQRAPSLRFAPI